MKLKRTQMYVVIIVLLGMTITGLGYYIYRHAGKNPAVSMCSFDKKFKNYTQGKEEEITFFARVGENSNERIARKALLIRRPGADTTVFMFHGFMCNKKDVRFLVSALFGQPLLNKPFNTVAIDFRAHGDHTHGQQCSFGRDEMYDVMGIVDYIKQHPELKDTRRVVYGFSMGAVASIIAQSYDPSLFNMAIWDCPFDSSNNLIQRLLDRLKISILGYEFALPGSSLLKRYAYNPYVQDMIKAALKTVAQMDTRDINTRMVPIDVVEAIRKVEIPTFLIVCRNDEKAPVAAAQSLFDATRGFKRLWITNGRNHFDSYFYNPEKYIYKVRHFMTNILSEKYKEKKQAHVMQDAPEESKV